MKCFLGFVWENRKRGNMDEYIVGEYDVIVVGGGHAGIEAGLAAARLGVKTLLFTLSLDNIGNLPCNPSIGGTAKGHLVREIDALGGEMGKAADATTIQSRMLNRGKGPAVHSLRAQVDRTAYHAHIKNILENQKGLQIKQGEVVEVLVEEHHVAGVKTALGATYLAKAVIIATGTYLDGRIYVGDSSYDSGPDGSLPSKGLAESLENIGISLRRFKTGTPARAHARSINYALLDRQEGDEPIIPFSYETKERITNKVSCYIAYTNGETHQIIMDNLHRSPLYGGKIEGVGPRYCPSIEDKVVRFSDKERHQIFVEPMGLDTSEMYLQGMSSSLPEDVQNAFYKTIQGFENIEIMRNAYAIEYECCDPTDLRPSLMFIKVEGLYGAGQFNGTSGYEEAAAQGLLAGINAARQVWGEEPILLTRDSSYIGTLIDDLVTKGCSDPYRMMTSRSEYRLLLRQDNADERMTPLGYEIGLISEERYRAFQEKQEQIQKEWKRIQKVSIPPSKELNDVLVSRGTTPIETGVKLIDLLKRPQISYKDIEAFDPSASEITSFEVMEQVEIQIKYEGYIKRQRSQVEAQKRMEEKRLPRDLPYHEISGISLEAREKLEKIQPESIGQASRISGVSPADTQVLLIWLEQYNRNKGEKKHGI